MARLGDYLGSKYLKARDCDPPILLTITSGPVEKIGPDKEEKVVLHFAEINKGLVLNNVNGDTVEDITGTDDTDQMEGHKIVCFKTETDFGGRRIDCIRVRAPKKKNTTKKSSSRSTKSKRDSDYEEDIEVEEDIETEDALEDVPF